MENLQIERSPINQGFLKFVQWTQSGGQIYKDWYVNQPGYRNSAGLHIRWHSMASGVINDW